MPRIFWILLVLTIISSKADARIWHIQPDGTGDAPTIAAAIDSSVAGDVIEMACGIYHEEGLVIKSGITIRSETGQPDCVMIKGRQPANSPGSIFYSWGTDDTTHLEGLTITGGWASSNFWGVTGGGMNIYGSVLTVNRCLITGNSARAAGGVIIIESHVTFIDCVITENEATHSSPGGVTVSGNSSLSAYDTTIISNIAASFWPVDGYVANDSEAYFNCCDIDQTWWQFAGGGNYEVDDSDCDEVADEVQNWGTVKALYR
jgi:hypothetical protein